MCGVCSRRSLVTGAVATFIFGTGICNAADEDRRILCGFNDEGLRTYRNSMTSTSGDPRFDNAVIAELKRILNVIPIDPGFKYVRANNAAATPESIVGGTKGTVLIGLEFVSELVKQDDDGG